MKSVFMRSSHIWCGFGDANFAELLGDRELWLEDGRDLLLSDERIGRQGSRSTLLAAHTRGLLRKAADWGFDRQAAGLLPSKNYLRRRLRREA